LTSLSQIEKKGGRSAKKKREGCTSASQPPTKGPNPTKNPKKLPKKPQKIILKKGGGGTAMTGSAGGLHSGGKLPCLLGRRAAWTRKERGKELKAKKKSRPISCGPRKGKETPAPQRQGRRKRRP